MTSTNQIIRRYSGYVDTSGHEPPILSNLRLGGGVYVGTDQGTNEEELNNILQGRISLGIIGLFIIAAVGFYYYTRSVQGGG